MSESSAAPDHNDPRYLAAKRHVTKLRAFYTSLAIYVVVNLMLVGIDFATGGGWWFWWVTVFWGIGLVFQGFDVYSDRWGHSWEERKIQEQLRKDT
jgi:fatty acid desaturase